jgi:hypothetical protein
MTVLGLVFHIIASGGASDVSNFDQAAAFMGLSLLIFRL